jgi:hypothetical protein
MRDYFNEFERKLLDKLSDQIDKKFDEIVEYVARELKFPGRAQRTACQRKMLQDKAESLLERWETEADASRIPYLPRNERERLTNDHYVLTKRTIEVADEALWRRLGLQGST